MNHGNATIVTAKAKHEVSKSHSSLQKFWDDLGKKLHMDSRALIGVTVGLGLLFLLFLYCLCKKCIFKRRKKKEGGKKGGKGVGDMKSAQLLGNAYKEKIQPDLEELDINMEDNEGVTEKEDIHLGKLQYSLDYDFQKGEVVSMDALIVYRKPKILFFIYYVKSIRRDE